ncbi:hypothetical protein [Desulfitobacterium sp. AusDCA]
MEGFNFYMLNYNIVVAFECLGYTEEAESYYRKCGNYPQDYSIDGLNQT